jgi:trigger factor
VTLLAVKERELPEADDDFAQIASQFDTMKELKADLKEQATKSKAFGQVSQARDMIVDELVKKVEIPVPQGLIDDEVQRHLENENRLEDDVHRAEVAVSSEKTFRSQILIDAIAEAEEVKVSQDELTQYLIQSAAQYGMEPGEFIKVLDENGQIPAMVGEVARGKTLALILEKANVVDTKGNKVDVTPFIGTPSEDDEFDTSGAADLLASANAGGGHEGHDHGNSGTDSHGRKSSNEHYGHDHS